MKLFEARNGQTCFSYVRCYIWAPDQGAAVAMALQAFANSKLDRSDKITVRALFDESEAAFATLPNDEGWEVVAKKQRPRIPR